MIQFRIELLDLRPPFVDGLDALRGLFAEDAVRVFVRQLLIGPKCLVESKHLRGVIGLGYADQRLLRLGDAHHGFLGQQGSVQAVVYQLRIVGPRILEVVDRYVTNLESPDSSLPIGKCLACDLEPGSTARKTAATIIADACEVHRPSLPV